MTERFECREGLFSAYCGLLCARHTGQVGMKAHAAPAKEKRTSTSLLPAGDLWVWGRAR